MDCDQELSSLYGYHVPSDLVGVNVAKLIPALQLPTGTNMNKVCVKLIPDICMWGLNLLQSILGMALKLNFFVAMFF